MDTGQIVTKYGQNDSGNVIKFLLIFERFAFLSFFYKKSEDFEVDVIGRTANDIPLTSVDGVFSNDVTRPSWRV